ncbi:MAG: hypothetical protein LBC67_01760 [Spirochaetales bacterium]|nr:hypothetical protein [Spirochaetales bacterium]
MKKPLILLAFVMLAAGVSAQVDEQEIRIDSTVVFENNPGAPEKVETLAEIRGIGEALGRGAAAERNYSGRYRVLHIVDPSAEGLFDADIFILESSAAVDHIRNLRFIIAGYLATAYGYGQRDAALLAEFITIYNAVHRKDMQYFTSKYKPAVMRNLQADRAGLSTTWRDWPGGTQILVPLAGGTRGTLSAIDTGAITDSAVVEELRSREDRGVESRKDMVDLKEREIAEQEKQLEADKKEIAQERKDIEKREQKAVEEIAAVQEKKAAIEEERPRPAEQTPAQAAKAEEARAQQREEVKKEETAIREEQSRIEEDKKAVQKKESEAAARESRIEEKKDEVRQERREIAADQEEVLKRQGSASGVQGIPFIKVASDTLGQLVLVNPLDGNVLSESPEPPLTVRRYESFGGGLAVILQKQGGQAARLSVLEKTSLKEKIAAREDVFPESSMRLNGVELFVVIRDSGKWYLGKYDQGLALLARSRTEVNPRTFILFSDANVFIEDPSGKVVPLALADMQ